MNDVKYGQKMNEFTFDTSGYVIVPYGSRFIGDRAFWPDLDPFAQGYVAAAIKAASVLALKGFEPTEEEDAGPGAVPRICAFTDLATETLMAMLRDCAEAQRTLGPTKMGGAAFWRIRDRRHIGAPGIYEALQTRFPPITLCLGTDKKIHQRSAG